MFANFGIKLHDLHFPRCGLFVFGRGVKMAGSSSGFQLDFFASAFGCHVRFSYLLSLAAGAQIGQHGINTVFVNQTQCSARYAQANPTVLALNPKTTVLQVRQKTTLGSVVGVGNVVSRHGLFARNFTYACHCGHS